LNGRALGAAAKAAFGGDAESRGVFARSREPVERSLYSVRVVNQADIEFRITNIEICERREVDVVMASARDRKVHPVNSPS